jgi:hypothetical protein
VFSVIDASNIPGADFNLASSYFTARLAALLVNKNIITPQEFDELLIETSIDSLGMPKPEEVAAAKKAFQITSAE